MNKKVKEKKTPSQIALPLVIFEEGKFIIPEEAKKLLSQENYKNIGIISLENIELGNHSY